MIEQHSQAYYAYFAGVTDLLAVWSSFATTAGTAVPNIAINTPHHTLASWLCNQTDVNVIMRNRKYNKHTCKEHCLDAHQHVRSESYRWSLGGAKATILAYNLLEHSRLRREELQDALAVGLAAPHHKPKTVATMKALGWAIPSEWDKEAA